MPQPQVGFVNEEEEGPVVLPPAVPAPRPFSAPENFINRELSWLEFNRRVLEEAQDATQPLIERVKFLTIFSSNLDEFFEIRVAGIKQQIESETSEVGADGLSPTETFNRIEKVVRELVATQYALWKDELMPALAEKGIRVLEVAELNAKRAADGLIGFARREGISHVIFGQSARSRWDILLHGSVLNRFLEEVRDAAVQIIPIGRHGEHAG